MHKKTKAKPAIVIHAGAGKFLSTKGKEKQAHESLRKIADEAFMRLTRESATSVAVWAVKQLEDDPQFNAGTGCKLQSDGMARLTASLMNGAAQRFSGVVNIQEVKNPILVAEKLQNEPDRVLAGGGAQFYARRAKFGHYNPVTEEQWLSWKQKFDRPSAYASEIFGTVGAVVVDRYGRVAAATSTGGKGMEIVGRVSDSATVAGNFASSHCAVSCTGVGEEIVEMALAARIVTRVDDGMKLAPAFSKTFHEMKKSKGRAGAIGVDRKGNVAVAHTTDCILHAIRTSTIYKGYP